MRLGQPLQESRQPQAWRRERSSPTKKPRPEQMSESCKWQRASWGGPWLPDSAGESPEQPSAASSPHHRPRLTQATPGAQLTTTSKNKQPMTEALTSGGQLGPDSLHL